METILSAKGLKKVFERPIEDIVVLDDCDFDLAPGATTAIIGPSGSGKSTLLNILSGLDRPDAGEIRHRERLLSDCTPDELAAWRRETVGFIFQFHFLLPDFTALENLLLPVRIAGRETREAAVRARELLDAMGLGDRMHHRPGELSGGEQQRVAVARAFMNRPGIVMADEPFGNLDREKGEQISDQLFELRAEIGSALVIVTHDLSLAGKAERILELGGGRLRGAADAPTP